MELKNINMGEVLKDMGKNNNDNGKKRVYIRPEDTLEFIYELSDKWKNTKNPIE